MNTHLRPAAVASMFYPKSAAVLAREVAQLLSGAAQVPLLHAKVVIVPHAGYIYSGALAATIYASLRARRDTVRRVVLLGPAHRAAIDGLALPACGAFATPLGSVAIDAQASALIADLQQVVLSAAAHADEHALEVQLPFLQTVFSDFSLLPLVVGRSTPEAVAEVLERLWGGDETLIVVSSDLSHYLAYAVARQFDTLEPTLHAQQACGAIPINGLLCAARRHGLQAQQIALCNSGDTAGDKARVVGYGAFAFLETEQHAH